MTPLFRADEDCDVRSLLGSLGIARARVGAKRALIRVDAVAPRRFDGEEPAIERHQRSQDLQAQEIRAGQRGHAPFVVLAFGIKRRGVVLDDSPAR